MFQTLTSPLPMKDETVCKFQPKHDIPMVSAIKQTMGKRL